MKYGIIIEEGDNNFSAFAPDLPGCVSTGDTLEDVKNNMKAAIEFHIVGLKEDGMEIPSPVSISETVEVAA
jgi:predicted RNase H-like HicB family nuclease